MENIPQSNIAQWYRGRSIFITGGTGFLGKCLVEKLLRTCDVRKIYLLIRSKRGVDPCQRLEDLFNFQLFDNIKETQPEVLQKLVPIRGDITAEGLGISDEDEDKIIQNCSVIFHVAATIHFEEPLKRAVNMNVLGLKRVIALAKKLDVLKALVHVSTAYSNCHIMNTSEKLYPVPMDPKKLIQLTEWLDEDLLKLITPKLIAPRPNTYTYTKAVAEHVLAEECADLPAVIVRPSIVCGAWKEPIPGWVDNIFAFSGLLVGLSQGLCRSLYVKENISLDFIPVDCTINLMIAAAWNADKNVHEIQEQIPIYTSCSTSENPLSVVRLAEILKEKIWRVPPSNPFWYPDGSMKTSKFTHNLHVFLTNIVPAHFSDFLRKISGKQPMYVKLCNKMLKQLNVLEYFMTRNITFDNQNVQSLWKQLEPADKEAFNFDASQLNWDDYMENYQIGCKRFIMKEDTNNMVEAKKTLKRFYYAHKFVQALMGVSACFVFSSNPATSIYTSMLNATSYCLTQVTPMLAAAETPEEVNL